MTRLGRLLLTSLAACGGAAHGTGKHAAPSDVPPDLLTKLAPQMRPVIVEQGTPYLWLHLLAWEDPLAPAAEPPPCEDVNNRGCWKTLPAEPDRVAQLGALPPTLTVLTPRGTCVATVGAVKLVNTAGCDLSMTYGAELTGCGADLAPIGFAGGDVPPELTWRGAPGVTPTAVPADLHAIADPVLRAQVTAWLAESAFAAPRHDLKMTQVALDVGAEALTTLATGAVVGASADECEWEVVAHEQVGLRRGDTLVPLQVPPEWSGALAWRGRVVGVVSGLPRDLHVDAIGPDATATRIIEREVWTDNEECREDSWTGVSYPCGL